MAALNNETRDARILLRDFHVNNAGQPLNSNIFAVIFLTTASQIGYFSINISAI